MLHLRTGMTEDTAADRGMAVAAVVGVGSGTTADIDAPPACFLESAACKAALRVLPRSLGRMRMHSCQ